MTQLEGTTMPLALGGTVIDLDTTDFATLDYAGLVMTIRKLLESSR